ncbi:MAG: Hsp20/alpha crystallin family protein [Bacteroidota bacterium]
MSLLSPFIKPSTPRRSSGFWGRSPWMNEMRDDDINLPAVNVTEGKTEIRLELIAPGLEKEDFDINVQDGRLTISAERRTETDSDEEEGYAHREYRYSSFSRSFSIPEHLDEDNITAKYHNGVLKVYIKRREQEETQRPSRRISVS